MTELREPLLSYLERVAPRELALWTGENDSRSIDIFAACDVLYALKLAGCENLLCSDAGLRFARLLERRAFAGGIGRGHSRPLSVHQTAYALGALNLLNTNGRPGHREALSERGWAIEELVDPRTLLPRWPTYLAHHSWRVGHWIGGVPSIIKSLWSLVPDLAKRNNLPALSAVLISGDALIDDRTGTLRAYKTEALQYLFRFLYRYRHDPMVGEIGGIAHLHWVNYASGRLPYKAARALFDRAWSVLQRRPFIESEPYCLDFDVVQIARTSLPGCEEARRKFARRSRDYAGDLQRFYLHRLNPDYALHKLPGGLATLHECALATGQPVVSGLDIEPVDIVKGAYWI